MVFYLKGTCRVWAVALRTAETDSKSQTDWVQIPGGAWTKHGFVLFFPPLYFGGGGVLRKFCFWAPHSKLNFNNVHASYSYIYGGVCVCVC